jgi:CheY-like chemotaxis protein
MKTPTTALDLDAPASDGRVEVLVADDDAGMRALLAARVALLPGDLAVLEAADGAEAVQVGLQRRPRLALLDVQMPRLGGIEAAVTLRGLHPGLRLALHTGAADLHRGRARELRLPLLDKRDPDAAIRWLELQVGELGDRRRHPEPRPAAALRCTVCGYGAVRSTPPDRCPLCQSAGRWARERPRALASGPPVFR